jgi:N-acetylglutamate synthase-like GNAT family acetyltransferase
VIGELPAARFLLLPVPVGDERRGGAVGLLAAGPRSVPHVLRWAEIGDIYVLVDPAAPAGDGAVAAVLTLPVGSGTTVELRLIEVAPPWRDSDVGVHLLLELADALRSQGARRAVAGVGNAELDRIDLLTRAGFRMSFVERDSCTAANGWARTEDGALSRDILWFEGHL